mmetsp:Transcript_24205/g.50729  ORF Transcript_24205/g.50729 Transcript_24205/m.50729 type:complete len:107 (-) Transcript_24205:613-933(-)
MNVITYTHHRMPLEQDTNYSLLDSSNSLFTKTIFFIITFSVSDISPTHVRSLQTSTLGESALQPRRTCRLKSQHDPPNYNHQRTAFLDKEHRLTLHESIENDLSSH